MQHNSKLPNQENKSTLQALLEVTEKVQKNADLIDEHTTLHVSSTKLIGKLKQQIEFKQIKERESQQSLFKVASGSELENIMFAFQQKVYDIANMRGKINDEFNLKKEYLKKQIASLSPSKKDVKSLFNQSPTSSEYQYKFNGLMGKLESLKQETDQALIISNRTNTSQPDQSQKQHKGVLSKLTSKFKDKKEHTPTSNSITNSNKPTEPSVSKAELLQKELEQLEKAHHSQLVKNEADELKAQEEFYLLKTQLVIKNELHENLIPRDVMLALLRFYWDVIDYDNSTKNTKHRDNSHQLIADQIPVLQQLLKKCWCAEGNRSAWTLVGTLQRLNNDFQKQIRHPEKPSDDAVRALFLEVLPVSPISSKETVVTRNEIIEMNLLVSTLSDRLKPYAPALGVNFSLLNKMQPLLQKHASEQSHMLPKPPQDLSKWQQRVEACEKALHTNFEKAAEELAQKLADKKMAVAKIKSAMSVSDLSQLPVYQNYLKEINADKNDVESQLSNLNKEKNKHLFPNLFNQKPEKIARTLNSTIVQLDEELRDLPDQSHFDQTKKELFEKAELELDIVNLSVNQFLDAYPQTHEKDKLDYVTAKALLFYEENKDALQIDNEFMFECIKYYYILLKVEQDLLKIAELKYIEKTPTSAIKSVEEKRKFHLFPSKKIPEVSPESVIRILSGVDLEKLKAECSAMIVRIKYLINLYHADVMHIPFHVYFDTFRKFEPFHIQAIMENKATPDQIRMILPSYPINEKTEGNVLRHAMNQ